MRILACSGLWIALAAAGGYCSDAKVQDASVVESAARHPLNPVSFIELPRLEQPSLAPNGKQLLVIWTQADWAKNEHVENYQLIDIARGTVVELKDWQKTVNRCQKGNGRRMGWDLRQRLSAKVIALFLRFHHCQTRQAGRACRGYLASRRQKYF